MSQATWSAVQLFILQTRSKVFLNGRGRRGFLDAFGVIYNLKLH